MQTLLLSILYLFSMNFPDCSFPEEIKQVIRKERKAFTMINPGELTADWREYIHENDCPTLIDGDFNGDGKTDYCALVHNGKSVELVIFQSKGNSLEIIQYEKIGFGMYDSGIGLGLEKVNAGKVQGFEDSITLKHPGINLIKFESSSVVIYYDNHRYNEFWIDD